MKTEEIEIAKSSFVLAQILATLASFLIVAAGFFYGKDLYFLSTNMKYSEGMFYMGLLLGWSSLLAWFAGICKLRSNSIFKDAIIFVIVALICGLGALIVIFLILHRIINLF